MKDFLLFRRMITPQLVQIVFWCAMLWLLYGVVLNLRLHNIGIAIQLLILGPICFRLAAELFLVLFRIYDNVVDINKKLIR